MVDRAEPWFVSKSPQILEGLGDDSSLMVLTSFPLYLAEQNLPGAAQITEGVEMRDRAETLRWSLLPEA